MNYISTRNKNVKLTSAEAIKKGLSDDGGLFVPDEFPKIKKADIESLLGKTYIERANFILSKFLNALRELMETESSAVRRLLLLLK